MTAVSQLDLLRAAALKNKNKSDARVTSDTILAVIVAFLNSTDLMLAVEDTFPTGKSHSSIVARFKNVVMENNLSELVYPVVQADHVWLVKFEQPVEENEEDNTDDDQ